jgi:geranylgeranyl pyrophosphate synthase
MKLERFIEVSDQMALDLIAQAGMPLRGRLEASLKRDPRAGAIWSGLVLHTASAWQVAAEAVVALNVGVRFFTLSAEILDEVMDEELPPDQPLSTAVNTGAALLSLAQLALLKLNRSTDAIERLNRACLAAFTGQQHELEQRRTQPDWLALAFSTEEHYLERLRLVTGAPVAAVCRVAAGQAAIPLSSQERRCLDEFGLNFGVAQHINNDMAALLPQAGAKPDLLEIKPSLPLIFLYQQLPEKQYYHLVNQARHGDLAARTRFWQLLQTSGAYQYASVLAELHYKKAWEALLTVPPGQRLYRRLARQMTEAVAV